MKQLTFLFLFAALLFTLPETQATELSDHTIEQQVDRSELLALNVVPKPQAEDEAANVTPDDVADIIEEKVQPIIDEAVEQIRNAPDKGSSPASWITWAVAAAMSFIGVIVAVFFSGSKRNLKLD